VSLFRSSGVGEQFGVIPAARFSWNTIRGVERGEFVGDVPEIGRGTEIYRVRIAFVLFLEE